MIDPNAFDVQAYGSPATIEVGGTNVLPTIQGTTEVLPAIGGFDAFTQGGNTVLQDTAGLGGTTQIIGDTNTYFGTTTDTTAVFGQTLTGTTTDGTFYTGDTQILPTTTTDTNAFYGTTQVLPATTTDGATFYGDTQIIGTTTDTNAFLTGATTLPVTTTDANAFYGTTQVVPATNVDPNTFFAGTTQIPDVTGFATQGNVQPITTQTTYGTTPDLAATAQTAFVAPGVPITAQTTAIPTTTQVATTNMIQGQPQVQNIPQATQVATPGVAPPNQLGQNIVGIGGKAQGQHPPLQMPRIGGKLLDEDFRRGRPLYNDIQYKGYKPSYVPIRPNYKTTLNKNGLNAAGVNNVGVGVNNIGGINNVKPGLDKLGRGGSYDVYGRGINPLLNKVGLGQVNNIQPAGQNVQLMGPNAQKVGQIKDFL